MFWSCFGHVSVDLIKYANEYLVTVRNRTRCNECITGERIGDTEGLTDLADMDTAGGTKMPACVNLDCPYLDDFRGICIIAGTDEDCPLIEDD